VFSAVSEGASRAQAYGYELPVNKGMKYVFDAAMRTCFRCSNEDVADLRNAVPAQAQLLLTPAEPLAPRIGLRRLSSRRASE